jgi:hypothetical protein
VLFELRRRSILPMVPANRLPKSNPPPGAAESATRTPSTSTSSCSASAPRTRTPVKLPAAPLRLTLTPGARASIRVRSAPCTASISARPITVTGCPDSPISIGVPVAVTVMAVWSCAEAGAQTDAKPQRNKYLYT